jgi:hypothetical protein
MITYIATPDYYRDYISHHGILGMHWGRRNGPPYPLGDGDHSASEKKAGWKKSLGSGKIVKKKVKSVQTEEPSAKAREFLTEEFRDTYLLDDWGGIIDPDNPQDFDTLWGEGDIAGHQRMLKEYTGEEASKEQVRSTLKETYEDYYEITKKNSEPVKNSSKKSIEKDFPGFKNFDNPYDNDFTNDWIKLSKLVNEKSGDWYNSRGKSRDFRRIINEYMRLDNEHRNDRDKYSLNSDYRKKRYELDDELCKVVLRDIGYANTKKNRDYIRSVIFWD